MSKSKFKNTEELEKAYKELEKEFTKKSQKLAEVEKTNYVTLLHNEMDNLLNDYAKRRISDLEAKLAESEKKNFELVATINLKEHKPAFCTLADRDCEALGQVEELKQQLAEKNKEIENIKLCRCVNCKNEYEFMLEGLVEDLEKQIDKDDQDKISFAITQLEKIKDKFREIYDKNRKHHLSVVKCYEVVDEQIAELSNENKGKGE